MPQVMPKYSQHNLLIKSIQKINYTQITLYLVLHVVPAVQAFTGYSVVRNKPSSFYVLFTLFVINACYIHERNLISFTLSIKRPGAGFTNDL